ncbi:hypothetical protein FHS31_002468 [Sphingomonas vulcanisoli]|uniref:Sulfur globule protein n=1 Tax=Sphingomonas vulcanisoli TaxID=1658060 RepID=A0ABX0TTK1_9SPHN|nr:hypothetical protein [Sphingomonas vulcanisoli]NIJ08844.1 hypothetical protein [Sphingomonas vulcanisoli]
MRKFITSALAGLALASSAIGVAAPADAQRFHGGGGYRGGWHGGYRGGWGGGAVAAGIIGLGVGAAIASRPYYGGYKGYAPGYYYDDPYAYGYGECRTDWRWDGYRGRYFPVRYCY